MTTTNANSILVFPFGGKLVDLVISGDESDKLRESASHLPSIQLTERAACDLELLAVGGLLPHVAAISGDRRPAAGIPAIVHVV